MLGVASILLRAHPNPQTPASPLVGDWTFDETESPEFGDLGPGNVPLTIVGPWAGLETGSLVQGVVGTSAYTSGGGYATLPAGASAHTLSALTISFYFQRNSAFAKQILLAAGDGGEAGDFSIEVLANGRLRAWHTGQDARLRFFEGSGGITGTDLQVGNAYRIDLSLGPQGARIYLDGAPLASAAIPSHTNGWNNSRKKYLGRWTDGVQAPAMGAFDHLRLWNRQLTNAEIADIEPAQSTTLPPIVSATGFACVQSGGGTLVNLGTADDLEAVTNLATGGAARYDASGLIGRVRWTGSQGCSTPNRSATSNQFLYRFTANHNGGCISGGAAYGNLTPDDNYDSGDGKNWALYPCSDGGQIYIRRPGGLLQNFSIEGFRMHSCWDPFRTSFTGSEVTDNITIKGCWATCIRDDFVENDTGRNITVHDNLVGDIIGQNSGCWVFYSTTGNAGSSNDVTISNNLVWSHQMRANRPRDLDGYCCGALFKISRSGCPDLHLTDNIFMADHANISEDNGNPLGTLLDGSSTPTPLVESSGNIIIWRDLAGIGSYPWELPVGFTLLTGSEGESYWNEQVAAWKAAHPNVRRLNKTGIPRPFLGGTTSVVDQG